MWRDQRIARLCSSLAAACALLPIACAPRQAGTTLHELAEQYVRLTLQIAQHRPNLVDSWTGPTAWQPGPRAPVAVLRAAVDDVLQRVESLNAKRFDATDAPRVAYLQGQMRALSLITRRLLGESTRFQDETQAQLGRPLPTINADAITRARAALESALPGDELLDQRYAAFRSTFMVDPRRTDAVVRAAIDACRAATAPYVVLPPDERLTLAFDEAIEWDAHAQYRGGHETLLKINTPGGHDVAALLHMGCHETYAGHHAQHILIDDALVRGRGWMEFHLTPAFGPHRLISEGAAEAGVALALSEEDRAKIYREKLLPLAGLPIEGAARLARIETLASALDATVPAIVGRYLDNEVAAAETVKRLSETALLPAPEQFLGFAERHRTNAVVYPVGKAVVSEWVARGTTPSQRWRRLQDLFTRTPFALN